MLRATSNELKTYHGRDIIKKIFAYLDEKAFDIAQEIYKIPPKCPSKYKEIQSKGNACYVKNIYCYKRQSNRKITCMNFWYKC